MFAANTVGIMVESEAGMKQRYYVTITRVSHVRNFLYGFFGCIYCAQSIEVTLQKYTHIHIKSTTMQSMIKNFVQDTQKHST